MVIIQAILIYGSLIMAGICLAAALAVWIGSRLEQGNGR